MTRLRATVLGFVLFYVGFGFVVLLLNPGLSDGAQVAIGGVLGVLGAIGSREAWYRGSWTRGVPQPRK